MDQRAYLGRTGIGNGDYFDKAGGVDGSGRGSGEQGVDVDVPFGHQPQQRLGRDNGPREHEGPFLALNIGVIALRRQVESEEGRPDNQERPNVCMQLQWEGVMQGRIFNLGVICEFCPGGVV